MFEVDVDMRDPACLRALAALNQCTALEFDSNDSVRTVSYFCTCDLFLYLKYD